MYIYTYIYIFIHIYSSQFTANDVSTCCSALPRSVPRFDSALQTLPPPGTAPLALDPALSRRQPPCPPGGRQMKGNRKYSL